MKYTTQKYVFIETQKKIYYTTDVVQKSTLNLHQFQHFISKNFIYLFFYTPS
jgi:hypothetical protein